MNRQGWIKPVNIQQGMTKLLPLFSMSSQETADKVNKQGGYAYKCQGLHVCSDDLD